METNGKHIDFNLISRYLSGETSKEEEHQLNEWLDSAKENRKLFGEYKTIWDRMEKVSSIAGMDMEAEWSELESRLEAAVPEIEGIRGIDSKKGKSTSMMFYARRIAIAAIVVLALALGGLQLIRNTGFHTATTADLSEEIVLPDGSTITLNSFSSLEYPKKFKKDQRGVNLEGEGFFEVNGNPDWPFVIKTEKVDIRVLGTSFNVNAYMKNPEIEVIVKTGQVAVTHQGEIPKTIILKPGSKAIYNKEVEELSLSTNIDRNYLAWKTKNLVFQDESLGRVTMILNKVYGSEIIIPSDSLKTAKITSTFNDQSLEAILNVLSETLDLQVIEYQDRILLTQSK